MESNRPKKRLRLLSPGRTNIPTLNQTASTCVLSPSSEACTSKVCTSSKEAALTDSPTSLSLLAQVASAEKARVPPLQPPVAVAKEEKEPKVTVAVAPEKVAIEGVSLFLRDMKSDKPQDIASAMDTMALCLRREMRMRRNDYAKTLFAINGHKAVVVAMKKWGDNEALQRAGCGCIYMMADQGIGGVSSSPTALAVAIMMLEVVLKALKAFPRSYAVQRNALAALDGCCDQLFSTPATTKTSKKAHQVVGIQGVQLVVRAMKLYPNELDLQSMGCSFLHTLSTKKECKHSLIRFHAMSTVTAAYENHPTSAEIKSHLQNMMDGILL